ncbi:hypothetical protein NGI46_07840 [Peribacillus butanolivorans]|uniref:hypothetical protein n=1 Tax=Peribacillus butanolivorans TaxID=421767 RepID=UPI00207CCFB0|nr:hypothetical protein [Peribacillus butanolivorans]MCO0597377.1 hypothetical protein [Peribacillus butanolivorans]
MEWDLLVATEYITLNTLDNEDFIDGDDTRKTALLNVASRTLNRKFNGLTIPNEAVYLFGAVLASAYNDTNKLQQQGVAGFSIKGISFTFKDWAKKGLDALVPTEVVDLINEANGVEISTGRSVKWTTL